MLYTVSIMNIINSMKKMLGFKKAEHIEAAEEGEEIYNPAQNQRIIRDEIDVAPIDLGNGINLINHVNQENEIPEPQLEQHKKRKNPFRKITKYCSCIILSASTLSQMIIGHFVPGRGGDRAVDAVEVAGHNLAIIAHDVADDQEDNDFYEIRAALERSHRYPYIEGWARYLSETANSILGFANRCTQYVATGKIPISIHDFILGVQVMLLIGSCIGIKTSESTTSMIQSLTISSAASRVAQHYYPPTIIVSELSNNFFDFLSDKVIRPIIYFHTDILECILDKILHKPAEQRPVAANIHQQENAEWREMLGNEANNRAVLCLI